MTKCLNASILIAAFLSFVLYTSTQAQNYDTVILNARVIDPETNMDGVRNIGISNGTITAISTELLHGNSVINAESLTASPGFIDLHQHGQDEENYRLKVMDGVTSALELEIGTAEIIQWYEQRAGNTFIHHGVSIGHVPVRMKVLGDPPVFLPGDQFAAARHAASDDEIAQIVQQIDEGLKAGAPAVGFGLEYTQAASYHEALEVMRAASRYGAHCHIHMRYKGTVGANNSYSALEEVIAGSAITGAPVHVVHITSTGVSAAPRLLGMIAGAQKNGVDITTECYPYTAGMTAIESSIFSEGWQEELDGIGYGDLQWVETGKRLTEETFNHYRKIGGLVLVFFCKEDLVINAIANPLTMIASDGIMRSGKGHPRTAGTYSRVLCRYVRELKSISLMDAIRKMSLMPAQRLERRVPAMKKKGRLQVGADADITIFNPDTVTDHATYENPAQYSSGIEYVLVNGELVVNHGKLIEEVRPGKAIRAPVQ